MDAAAYSVSGPLHWAEPGREVTFAAAHVECNSLKLCTSDWHWASIEHDGTLRITDVGALQRYADSGSQYAGLAKLMLRVQEAGLSDPA